MVGADGAGADEAHRGALQQFAIDPRHRAHEQHIHALQRRPIDATPGHATDLAETGKELIDQRDVFVGKDVHGVAPVGEAHSRRAADALPPSCVQRPGVD